ncbi:MAG: extracellular solute-binding protein [Acholeplasmatales bacterium]|nr:MAG: extracellular solute-binding protein [Acholeplasmatales bacterium]
MTLLKNPRVRFGLIAGLAIALVVTLLLTLGEGLFGGRQPSQIDPIEIPVTSIEIVGAGNVLLGSTVQYGVIVGPDNATNTAVTWQIFSRGGEATIDAFGSLEAQAAGAITLRATAESGLFVEKQIAILTTAIHVSAVTIEGPAHFTHGERETYSLNITPADATYSNVVWRIQSGQGRIDANGRLAAKAGGPLTIGVRVDGVEATFTVEVAPYEGPTSNVKVLLNRVDLRNTILRDYKTEFEALYPMYRVTFETLLDYENNARMRLSGNDYGDVLLIPSSVRAQNLPFYFAPIGPLESLETSWRYVGQKAYEGLVYGLPTYGNVNGILYNKHVFETAGVDTLPATPEAFLQAMAMIRDHYAEHPDFIAPYYTNKSDGWPLDQWQGNISGVSGDPNYYYNVLPADRQAFAPGNPHYTVYKLLYDLVDQGLIEADPSTTNWERSKIEFVKGNIGAMVLGSWGVSQFVDAAIAVRDGTFVYDDGTPADDQSDLANPAHVGYMPFPYTHPDGSIYSVHAPDFFMGIARNTKNVAGANDFLMWFLRESGYYMLTGGIPPRTDMPFPPVIQAFQDLGVELFEEYPASGTMIGKLELVEMESDLILWNPDWKNRLFEDAFYGRRSFSEVAQGLNDDWNFGIDRVFD